MLDPDATIADLLAPLADPNAPAWGSDVEREIHRRIMVAVWAYTYEIEAFDMENPIINAPLATDAEYDRECLLVRPEMETGNPVLDKFFREEFSPHTGLWVHRHPDKAGLARIAKRLRLLRDKGPSVGIEPTFPD